MQPDIDIEKKELLYYKVIFYRLSPKTFKRCAQDHWMTCVMVISSKLTFPPALNVLQFTTAVKV